MRGRGLYYRAILECVRAFLAVLGLLVLVSCGGPASPVRPERRAPIEKQHVTPTEPLYPPTAPAGKWDPETRVLELTGARIRPEGLRPGEIVELKVYRFAFWDPLYLDDDVLAHRVIEVFPGTRVLSTTGGVF